MKTAHTPGPWRVMQATSQEPDLMRIVYSANLERIALIPDVQFAHQSEAVADARLIAAAPDLLACLLDVLDADGDLYAMDFDRYRAAIAKATGSAA